MSKRPDIANQIRKYHNGELGGPAMHRLEKEALNDPFLAEALDGYEQAGADQRSNLKDIHSQLQKRINDKKRRVVLWRTISIAASVVIVLTAGILWFTGRKPADNVRIESRILPPPPDHNAPGHDSLPSDNIAQNTAPGPQPKTKRSYVKKNVNRLNGGSAQIAAAAPVSASDASVNEPLAGVNIQKDSARLNNVIAMEYRTTKKANFADSITKANNAQINSKELNPVSNELQGKVAGIRVSPAEGRMLSGIVIGGDDKQPIPGAVVTVKGTNIMTQTNANGKFTLPDVPERSTIDISFIGYTRREVSARKRDSLVIAMQPNNNSLSEVVVVGYGKKDEDEDVKPQYRAAQPGIGRDAYQKYLKSKALSPDGKAGVVKISFIVNPDNSLSDFTILKSVSAKTDAAAIALVKYGPAWVNTDHKPEKVRLRIKFIGKQ